MRGRAAQGEAMEGVHATQHRLGCTSHFQWKDAFLGPLRWHPSTEYGSHTQPMHAWTTALAKLPEARHPAPASRLLASINCCIIVHAIPLNAPVRARTHACMRSGAR